ncbi:MAG: hypothetical protein ABI619_04815 [Betaproteobacteria bacterium]
MRLVMFVASLVPMSVCHAAGFPGTYGLEHQHGRIVAKFELRGGRLSGTVNFMGKAQMALFGGAIGDHASGTICAKDGDGVFDACRARRCADTDYRAKTPIPRQYERRAVAIAPHQRGDGVAGASLSRAGRGG